MKSKQIETLVNGYHKMAERLAERLHEIEDHSKSAYHDIINALREESVSLQELTKTEAQQVSDWLKRDIHALSEQATKTRSEFREWFPFEVKAEEAYLWDKLMSAADTTTVSLLELKEEAMLADFELWHTGEVTAPGILECTKCGEQLHFKKAGHIPPCPKCGNTTFVRVTGTADDSPDT
jgi:predicted RNA-binding Zn-ribbon protein involved in translation (DUF1610 family)